MLRPSYSELMQILNDFPDLDNKITSRYAIVIAASKRARQIIDGAIPHATAKTNKAVSIAVSEMQQRLIRIIPDGDSKPDEAEDIEETKAPEFFYNKFSEKEYTKSYAANYFDNDSNFSDDEDDMDDIDTYDEQDENGLDEEANNKIGLDDSTKELDEEFDDEEFDDEDFDDEYDDDFDDDYDE